MFEENQLCLVDEDCAKEYVTLITLKGRSRLNKTRIVDVFAKIEYVQQYTYYWLFDHDLLYQNFDWVISGYDFKYNYAIVNMSLFYDLKPECVACIVEELGDLGYLFKAIFLN